MFFINWPYCFFFLLKIIEIILFFLEILYIVFFFFFFKFFFFFFFFIKDNRFYLIFFRKFTYCVINSLFLQPFLKLEDILNKTCLFNAISFIKKSIILSKNT